MRIHVIVTGFGQPFLETKQRIARANQETLRASRHDVTTTAYVYDDSDTDNLFHHVIRGPGIVGQFIMSLDPVIEQERYDRIVLMLDDVELLMPVFDDFVEECESREGIVQPSLSADSMFSHHYMLMSGDDVAQVDNDFGRHRCFEYFCYSLRSRDLRAYHALFNASTRCMWGLDYVVPTVLPCTLLRDYKIRHWFKGGLETLLSTTVCYKEMQDRLG